MLKAVSPWPGQFLRKSEGLGLGFVSRGMPVFPTQALAVAELRTNALHLMSNYTATYWLSQSQAVVQVVSRPVEMRAWVELIGELDRRHSP